MIVIQETLSQKEFLEKCKKGEKVFSGVLMQFLDIFNCDFDGLVIKDSRLLYCSFRGCNMSNVRFENCEIYWCGFYNQRIEQAIFIGCKIELSIFENVQFDRAKMQKCFIRLSGILWSNLSGIDISASTQIKLITDLSEVTEKIIEEYVSETAGSIERLDVSQRMKINEVIRADINRYNLKSPQEKEGQMYSREDAGKPLSYGEVRQFVEAAFGVYGKSEAYKSNKPYETRQKYR